MKLTKQQKERNEKLAKDLIKFIQECYSWNDICVFFNGKAISSNRKWNKWEGVMIEEFEDDIGEKLRVYEYINIESPKYWTEYANEEGITIRFDGWFYEWFHYYGGENKIEEFLKPYNAYFEIGNMEDISIYFN